MKNIKSYAEKEMKRMQSIMKGLKIISKSKLSLHFFDFANNYFKDGLYFFKKKMFIEAFEAFIISWSYIDCGLKLKFFAVPKEQRMWFTL
jgi:hypothetical protein